MDYILKQGYSGKNIKAKLDLFLCSEASNSLLSALNKMVFITASEVVNNSVENCPEEELEKITGLLHVQLNNTLKELIKYLTNKKQKTIDFIDLTLAKRMYEIVLRGLSTSETNLLKNMESFADVLTNLKSVYNTKESI